MIFEDDNTEKVEVRMSVSSSGPDSRTVSVNIPHALEQRIMRLCAREDASRSEVVRACLMLAMPVCESLSGMVDTVDCGPSDCPSDV
jgi:hypothetical protein